ncbi:MAG: hypothetical protein R3F59_38540 [Myxococcota bacterium]
MGRQPLRQAVELGQLGGGLGEGALALELGVAHQIEGDEGARRVLVELDEAGGASGGGRGPLGALGGQAGGAGDAVVLGCGAVAPSAAMRSATRAASASARAATSAVRTTISRALPWMSASGAFARQVLDGGTGSAGSAAVLGRTAGGRGLGGAGTGAFGGAATAGSGGRGAGAGVGAGGSGVPQRRHHVVVPLVHRDHRLGLGLGLGHRRRGRRHQRRRRRRRGQRRQVRRQIVERRAAQPLQQGRGVLGHRPAGSGPILRPDGEPAREQLDHLRFGVRHGGAQGRDGAAVADRGRERGRLARQQRAAEGHLRRGHGQRVEVGAQVLVLLVDALGREVPQPRPGIGARAARLEPGGDLHRGDAVSDDRRPAHRVDEDPPGVERAVGRDPRAPPRPGGVVEHGPHRLDQLQRRAHAGRAALLRAPLEDARQQDPVAKRVDEGGALPVPRDERRHALDGGCLHERGDGVHALVQQRVQGEIVAEAQRDVGQPVRIAHHEHLGARPLHRRARRRPPVHAQPFRAQAPSRAKIPRRTGSGHGPSRLVSAATGAPCGTSKGADTQGGSHGPRLHRRSRRTRLRAHRRGRGGRRHRHARHGAPRRAARADRDRRRGAGARPAAVFDVELDAAAWLAGVADGAAAAVPGAMPSLAVAEAEAAPALPVAGDADADVDAAATARVERAGYTRAYAPGVDREAAPSRGRGCQQAPDPLIRQLGDDRFSIADAVVERYTRDWSRLKDLGWSEVHRGADGKADGMRLGGIRCGSDPYDAGFRSGDVVHSINGRRVSSVPQAIAAYVALKGKRSFDVELTRGGVRRTVRFQLRA